jgi:hypothetical protein
LKLDPIGLASCKANLKKYAFHLYAMGLLATVFVSTAPTNVFSSPGVSLDPSWRIGVNLAVTNEFTFGRDFIFTYGPLSYFITRLPIGIGKAQILLFDTFVLANIAFILLYLFKNLTSYLSISLAFLSLLLIGPVNFLDLVVSVLFLIFIFMLFYHLSYDSAPALLVAVSISLLLFYMKLNLGLPSVILFYAFLIFLFLTRHSGRKFILGCFILYPAALYISALLVNADLAGYVQSALHIANDYNDAMFLKPEHPIQLYAALLVLFAFYALFVLYFKPLVNHKDMLLAVSFTGVFAFLLFKSAFVRADREHIYSFFRLIPVAIGLPYLFSTGPTKSALAKVFVVACVFSWSARAGPYTNVEQVANRFDSFRHYLMVALNAEPSTFDSGAALQQRRLPDSILETIGGKTVDVIPSEISYVYFNDLHYSPRPVMQSYVAYDDYLDNKNYEKYMSASAPQFILLSAGAIDDRYPFFDESKTRLAILQNYEVVESCDDILLLRRYDQPIDLLERGAEEGVARLGEAIRLKDTDDLQYMTVGIEYNLLGMALRALYQPPELRVVFRFEDGQEQAYRAVKPIVNGGVLVNKFVASTDQAKLFFTSNGKFNKKVSSIRFDSPQGWGFTSAFSYQIRYLALSEERVTTMSLFRTSEVTNDP